MTSSPAGARSETFLVQRACALFAALMAIMILAPHAFAQIQIASSPPPATLTNVSVTEDADTRIVLTFDPLAPGFSLIGNNTTKPSIAFAQSSRGMGAKYPAIFHGVVSGMSLEQVDTVLIMHFNANAPVHLIATRTGDKTVELVLDRTGSIARAARNAVVSTGPVPAQIDRQPGEDGFEVVPLRYADVSEVVGLLTEGQTVKSNDSFTPREPAFGSAGMGGSAPIADAPPVNEATDDPMAQSVDDSIAVDRRLNAIILKGSPDRIARLKEKIAEIDVPVQSVLLETMFVELTESGARNVGLDLNNAAGQIGVATFQTGAYIPSGFSAGHGLSSADFQAAIYAQVQNGRGRIVSKPRISAQSGATAKIVTGDALPILTSISLAGVNGVSQQVQYVNVGVTLQIAPRVSDDGFVTSHVFCVVSSVTGSQQGYPTISQREAQTSATVHDGETFVIGGLTEESVSKTSSKVPILGDIPVLNTLFDLGKDSRSKTDLYIVVTPHIIRRGDPVPEQVSSPPPESASH